MARLVRVDPQVRSLGRMYSRRYLELDMLVHRPHEGAWQSCHRPDVSSPQTRTSVPALPLRHLDMAILG